MKQIYEEAENRGWPGLGKEVTDICREIQIPNINTHKVSKTVIQKAVENSHWEDMMSQFDQSSKLQDIKYCDFKNIQPYFKDRNIENSRIKFKIRTKMLEKVPGNFKNKYKNPAYG